MKGGWWVDEGWMDGWWVDDYGRFSKRFVDKIKLCIANIMGTFLQSPTLLFVFTPFNRISSWTFLPREEKFGIRLVILLTNKTLDKL